MDRRSSQSVKPAQERLIIPRQSKGMSELYVHPGHGKGKFNFDAQPENVGGVGGTRYLFITESGDTWYLPLEVNNQGMRWENASHAKDDWERYSLLNPDLQRATMQAMWGDSPLANTLTDALNMKLSFDDMKSKIKGYDTWRSISAGEPKPNSKDNKFDIIDWQMGPYAL